MKNSELIKTNHKSLTPKKAGIPLNPWAVTGLADAESSFIIKMSKSKTGWVCQLRFQILLNIRDYDLICELKEFFGVGIVSTHQNIATYTVYSIKDLKIIINHFNNYPLVTAKSSDFKLWLDAYNLMLSKKHLTPEGRIELFSIKSAINLGPSNSSLSSVWPEFINVVPVKRPSFVFNNIPNSFWISGFVSGDGTLYIRSRLSSSHKLGQRIILGFAIMVHIREKDVIEGISKFLLQLSEPKFVYDSPSINMVQFSINSFSLINNTIIPFFDQFPLIGKKYFDFILFKEAASLIVNKEHLTETGQTKILKIKDKMNNYD